MLTHGNLTAAVSIFDVWGAPGRAKRAGDRAHDLRAAAVSHLRADRGAAPEPRARQRDLAASALRRRGRDARHRGQARDRFPGVPTMWIAIAAFPISRSRDLSSLATSAPAARRCRSKSRSILERTVGMTLKSGWGMTETCSPGTAHPPEGPDKPGSIGLPLPGIELDSSRLTIRRTFADRRGRRDPHQGAERHQGLLEPAEGNRRSFRRRPLPDRRHRLHRRSTATTIWSTARRT